MKLLVTGGCGFIGSNFIETCFKNKKNLKIVNVDALLTGGNKKNLEKIKNSDYRFVKGNICNKKLMEKLISNVDCIVNFAAESHVDRSINNSSNFVKSNIIGINTILNILKENKKIAHIDDIPNAFSKHPSIISLLHKIPDNREFHKIEEGVTWTEPILK